VTLGIVLIAKDNTIVIVSDKRVTEGNLAISAHGDIVEKIHKVTDKSGLTIAGDAGAAIAIIEPFLKEISLELARRKTAEIPITETAELFRNTAVEYFTRWFKDMTIAEWVDNVKNGNIPFFRVLLAGFDMDDSGQLNKPKIIELSSMRRFAPMAITTKFGVIGVTSIAQYLIYRFKKEDEDEGGVAGLAAFCITETSSQDDSVGDQFQIASFSYNKSFQFYSDEELNKIKNRCAELKTEFQTALFTKPKIKEEG
jgi:20S proteasome alpha/beta subunit